MVERRANGRRDEVSAGSTTSKPDKRSTADVGAALRNAFQTAVEEDVPAELLDLLRRLD